MNTCCNILSVRLTMWVSCVMRMLLSLLILVLGHDTSLALRITRVSVPSHIAVGESGWLQCDFLKEGESVYTLKWYLGLDEFYRWTPAEYPPIRTFPLKGKPLVVNTKESDWGRVRIQDVTLAASGMFRCEVSGEAPSFHTESAVATLTVVDLPDERPNIQGVKAAYQLHEIVMVRCTSPNSKPPATLAFYINDEQADPSWLTHYPPTKDPKTGLQTAMLGLHFSLLPRLLEAGPARVKCTASIEGRYWESSVVQIHSDVPYQASIMEGHPSAAAEHGVAWLVLGVSLTWLLLQ